MLDVKYLISEIKLSSGNDRAARKAGVRYSATWPGRNEDTR